MTPEGVCDCFAGAFTDAGGESDDSYFLKIKNGSKSVPQTIKMDSKQIQKEPE